MVLDYQTKGKVKINMRECINTLLLELEYKPGDWNRLAVTLAMENLFKIDEEAEKLNMKESEHFHHVVAQLLFLCKQGCPDLQTGVAFLTTQVKEPDHNDL